jgi:hypothetical protein
MIPVNPSKRSIVTRIVSGSCVQRVRCGEVMVVIDGVL